MTIRQDEDQGFAAAMIAALIGASLRFNATSSLLSIVTAIVGAAVGANLILLILDMTGDRSNRKRFPTVGALAAPMQASAGHARPATVDKPVGAHPAMIKSEDSTRPRWGRCAGGVRRPFA